MRRLTHSITISEMQQDASSSGNATIHAVEEPEPDYEVGLLSAAFSQDFIAAQRWHQPCRASGWPLIGNCRYP